MPLAPLASNAPLPTGSTSTVLSYQSSSSACRKHTAASRWATRSTAQRSAIGVYSGAIEHLRRQGANILGGGTLRRQAGRRARAGRLRAAHDCDAEGRGLEHPDVGDGDTRANAVRNGVRRG